MTTQMPVEPQGTPLGAGADAGLQARNSFFRVISHELRTPLTALTGYGELLSDGILGELTPLQHDTVERMRLATHQLTTMIDRMLTFSRIEGGAERVVLTWVSPLQLLRSVVAVAEPLARKKGIALVAGDDVLVSPLRSDEEKIRQILMNLTANAIEFTDCGEVRISIEEDDEEVRFVVGDTGIGIAADDLRRLFQPFTQLDSGLTKRHGGSGLGLYISMRLAELVGGRIDVVSTVGVGSTFTLRLPRRVPAQG